MGRTIGIGIAVAAAAAGIWAIAQMRGRSPAAGADRRRGTDRSTAHRRAPAREPERRQGRRLLRHRSRGGDDARDREDRRARDRTRERRSAAGQRTRRARHRERARRQLAADRHRAARGGSGAHQRVAGVGGGRRGSLDRALRPAAHERVRGAGRDRAHGRGQLLGSLGIGRAAATRWRRPTREAHALFLQGQVLFNRRRRRRSNSRSRCSSRPIARDPKYAQAQASLAMALAVLPSYVQGNTDAACRQRVSRRPARHRDRFDDPRVVRGARLRESAAQRQSAAPMRMFRNALALDSTVATAWGWYGLLCEPHRRFPGGAPAHRTGARAGTGVADRADLGCTGAT